MSGFFLGAAIFLLSTLVAGLWRVWRGPTPFDRMLAAQLFGTTGVATVLLLALGTDAPMLVNVALVIALLALVAVAAFVRRVPEYEPPMDGSSAQGEASDVD